MDTRLTPYADVNGFVEQFPAAVVRVIRENVVGVYLTGSLSYDAFNYPSSDIDFVVIVRRPVSPAELRSLEGLHRAMEGQFEKWSKRLECSYTPLASLPSVLPPADPRPWYWGGEGWLYAEAPNGNEWIINRYFLYERGIALYGPEFREIAGPVEITEVQKACIRDLFVEWEPKRRDPKWFRDSHRRAYFILNLCRILYAVVSASLGSKQTAAAWVKERYDARWGELVDAASQWGYGAEFDPEDESIAFLDFVISVVAHTELFKQLSNEPEMGQRH